MIILYWAYTNKQRKAAMTNYQIKNIGELQDLSQYIFAPKGTGIRLEGKIFLADLLGISSMEISLNKNKPGTGMEFFHKHTNHEEIYLFLAGEGEMNIDGKTVPVKAGTIVNLKPNAVRSWWNTGKTDLIYIVMQAPVNGMKVTALEDGQILDGKVPWHKDV